MLREYQPEDLSIIAQIWHEEYARAYPELKINHDSSHWSNGIDWLLKNCKIHVAVKDECVIGFMALKNDYIDQMYIKEKFWRQGIGSQFIALAKSKSPSYLHLHTLAQNERAIAFYKKHGFIITKRGIAPDEKVPDVHMEFRKVSLGKTLGERQPHYKFTAIDAKAAAEITAWRYPAPYDIYNMSGSEVSLLDPVFNYWVACEGGSVVAFLCWGHDARVGGFDYDETHIDIGWGLRPDIVGKGSGRVFLCDVLEFIESHVARTSLRATVAKFNIRCQRTCESSGFRYNTEFVRKKDGREFVVLCRGS